MSDEKHAAHYRCKKKGNRYRFPFLDVLHQCLSVDNHCFVVGFALLVYKLKGVSSGSQVFDV